MVISRLYVIFLIYYEGHVPYDGVPREELVTISLPLTIIVSILNILSIICAGLCLLFNIVFRNTRLAYVHAL